MRQILVTLILTGKETEVWKFWKVSQVGEVSGLESKTRLSSFRACALHNYAWLPLMANSWDVLEP